MAEDAVRLLDEPIDAVDRAFDEAVDRPNAKVDGRVEHVRHRRGQLAPSVPDAVEAAHEERDDLVRRILRADAEECEQVIEIGTGRVDLGTESVGKRGGGQVPCAHEDVADRDGRIAKLFQFVFGEIE